MDEDRTTAIQRWMEEKGLSLEDATKKANELPIEFDDGAGADLRYYDLDDLIHDKLVPSYAADTFESKEYWLKQFYLREKRNEERQIEVREAEQDQ